MHVGVLWRYPCSLRRRLSLKPPTSGPRVAFQTFSMDENRSEKPQYRSSKIRRVIRILLCALFCMVLVVTSLCLFVRFGVDGDYVVALLLPRLETAIGKKIDCSSATLSWLSLETFEILLTDLQVRDSAGAPAIFYVPKIVAEVSLFPVLRGVLLVNRAEISRPLYVLRPGADIRKGEAGSAGIQSALQLLSPTLRNVSVDGGSILMARSSSAETAGEPLFSNIRIALINVTPRGAEDFTIKGDLPAGAKSGAVSISGMVTSSPFVGDDWRGELRMDLTGCSLHSFIQLASYFGVGVPIECGTANLACQISGSPTDCTARGEMALSRTTLQAGQYFVRPVTLDKCRLGFAFQRRKNDISLEISDAAAPGISFSLEARAENVSTTDATLTVALRNADLDLQKAFPLIPLNLLDKEDRERLTDAGLKGHIRLTGGSWTGRISELPWGLASHGTLMVDALADRVSGFIPGFGVPLTDATGQVRLSADEMLFKGISVTVGASPIVLNGWITNLRTSPIADLFVSMKAQAQDLKPILENRTVEAHLEPWLGWMREPQGGVSMTLDLKGDLKSPEMKGRLDLEDFQCRIAGLPLPLRGFNGSARFRSTGVTLSDLKGSIGESPVEIRGFVDPDKVDVTVDFKLSPSDLRKAGWLPQAFTVASAVPVSLNLKGKSPAVNFFALVSLNGNGLSFGHYLKKKPGVEFAIEASGIKDSNGFSIDEAYLVIDKNRIPAKGTIKDDGKSVISINLPPQGVPTSALIPVLDPALELQSGGRLEGDAVVRIDNSRGVTVDADIRMNHVSLKFPGFHKRTEGMTGSIRQRAKTLNWTLERARHGNSLFSGSIAITDFENPRVDVVLDYSFMDTTDYAAPPGYISPSTWGEWIRSNPVIRFLARSRGTGLVKVAKGQTSQRPFSDFKATVEGSQGLLRVQNWQVNFADGTLNGSGLFDIRSSTSIPLALELQGDRLKMERLMTSDPEWLRVTGNMVVDGRLEWRIGPNRQNHGIYKVGKIEVRMQDGMVNRFDVLSKVSSLLNLGSLVRGRLPDIIGQGLPFHRLTWTMEVFDNKWRIKDMRLLSDAARVDSSGMIFTDQDRIDFKVDISPLVGFDAIFSGLFGNLFTRNGKILTVPLKIRGPYQSPDIRVEPFDNLRTQQ